MFLYKRFDPNQSGKEWCRIDRSRVTNNWPLIVASFALVTILLTLVGTAFAFTITISNPKVTDTLGNTITTTIHTGDTVLVQESLTNTLGTTQPFTYLLQVQDQNGVTLSLSWVTGKLVGGATFTPSLGFIAPSISATSSEGRN